MLPNVNRSMPVTGSLPMNENISPIAPDRTTLALEVLSPVPPISTSARTMMATNSGGWKRLTSEPEIGISTSRTAQAIQPPAHVDAAEMARARPASPRCAIGKPSSVVG